MTTPSHRAIEQSGVIPFRFRRGRLEIALVTSRNGPHWTIPKGHVEDDLTPQRSAAKEAFEESGLIGETIGRSIGSYEYEKRGSTHEVRVYALAVTRELAEWPERHRRRREWMSVNEAVLRIRHRELRECIARFERAMERQRFAMAA